MELRLTAYRCLPRACPHRVGAGARYTIPITLAAVPGGSVQQLVSDMRLSSGAFRRAAVQAHVRYKSIRSMY